MRVFIAGATGVLGRAVIPQLGRRRHSICALVRSEERARIIRELGADPIVGDIFDGDFLRMAVRGSDAVMNLATAIPKTSRPRSQDWEMNDRLRREGTRNLVEAVRGSPISAFVQLSVAFVYGDRRGEWVREDAPPHPDPTTQSAIDGEALVLAAQKEFGLAAMVLRGAHFYGAEAWSTRALLTAVKRRLYPIVGNGDQYWHYVYVKDMAAACVSAVEHPAPGQVFFVADDWPFHAQEFLNYLAAKLSGPPPLKLPVPLARLFFGKQAFSLAQSIRFRTDKIKKILGWAPSYPTYREGLAEIFRQLGMRIVG